MLRCVGLWLHPALFAVGPSVMATFISTLQPTENTSAFAKTQ